MALSHNAANDVVLYEQAPRAGGHSATVDILYDDTPISVDTGFIVYNELNYPELKAMFAWLDVPTIASDMSFALSAGDGRFEWCGRDRNTFSGLFAQRRNLVSPRFYLLLYNIMRFQKTARLALEENSVGSGTLGDFLIRHRFPRSLARDYVLPMGAAIWSMAPEDVLAFPAQSFLSFFDNHRLLQWDRPVWRTVAGGSRNYVDRIGTVLGPTRRLGCGVVAIRRDTDSVSIQDVSGVIERFDHVVLATHAPQALALLMDASVTETAVLGAFSTTTNTVILHRDPRLMPKRRAAWAAWNVLQSPGHEMRGAAVTYWMNALQSIPGDKPLFVSLNPAVQPDPALTFGIYSYAHPRFDQNAISGQSGLNEIQGIKRTWFCGAWTGHGFHEDGLRSGLAVATALGATAPWHTAGTGKASDD